MAISDGRKIRSAKGMGLVGEVFARRPLEPLVGHLGIGHVRYSTTGSSRPQNVQPLIGECLDGIWCIAHNGNLVNARELRRTYQEQGAIFQTSTDSEILLHLLAHPSFRDQPRRVERALSTLSGAYCFLLMTRDKVMAARDPYGFRPLSVGQLGRGYVFASETCALEQVGASYIRDLLPGELMVADASGVRSQSFCEPVHTGLGQCIFEHIYFARPDSFLFGQTVQEVRLALGRQLAVEHPVAADLVIPVPDSGNEAALGYAQASGIPLAYGFIRNHYVGRTFIMPSVGQRSASVDKKLSVVPSVVRDQRVVVVDDSIVRGTTCRKRVANLRAAGAREVHFRISCPPIRFPCHFGIDFPTRGELVAADHKTEDIAQFIGADSVGYLSLEGLLASVSAPEDFCTGCFTNRYPVTPPVAQGKDDLELREHVESQALLRI